MGLRAVWHWNESALPIDKVIDLTKETGGNAIILKAGYQAPAYSANFHRRNDFPASAKKVKDAGLMLLAEVFCVPGSWEAEASCLRWAVREHKACAVVLNMEGPYEAETDGDNARNLLRNLGSLAPVWACTDFRGDRLALPYHRVLVAHVEGLMPMIYPRAFRPDTPFGDIQRAFDDAYGRWDALGTEFPRGPTLPILPAIQSYDGMDYRRWSGRSSSPGAGRKPSARRRMARLSTRPTTATRGPSGVCGTAGRSWRTPSTRATS